MNGVRDTQLVHVQGFNIKFRSYEGFFEVVVDAHGGAADERNIAVATVAKPGEDDEVEEVAKVGWKPQ